MAQQHINVSTPNDGLGDTLRNSQVKAESNFNELYSLKVDKSGTKVLSDTNFTQLEKDKLAGLVTGGQLQSNWTEGSILSKAYILNKPTNVSQFFNDSQFVPDVAIVGGFLRSAGEWVSPLGVFTPKIIDGFIGVTVGFVVGQTTFTLPTGAKCVDVFLAHAKQYKTTLNNTSLVNRWSQTGDIVTITKSPVLNNYIYIEYLL
jgi:hypothetical protein